VYILLVTGDVPGASTYFNPLMQQTIIPCTSGTRPTPSHEGMTIYETDTNWYVSWDGANWIMLGMTVTGAYTSTLTATTTNPTLGTGGIAEGRWTLKNGKWCTVRGTIKFGSAGTNAGSGQYLIALPFTSSASISNGVSNCGQGVVRAAGSLSQIIFYCTTSATSMAGITPSGSNLTSGTPGAWTLNDYISFSFTYEIT
jgi:hypothetical protein